MCRFEFCLLSSPVLLCPFLTSVDPLSPGLHYLPSSKGGFRGKLVGARRHAVGCSFFLFPWHIQKEDFPAPSVFLPVCTGSSPRYVALAAVGSMITAVAAASLAPPEPAGSGAPSSANSALVLGGWVATFWNYWLLDDLTFSVYSCTSLNTAIGSSPKQISKFEIFLWLP